MEPGWHGGVMGREQMRAGDDDRRQTADALKKALDEGRLDLSEYDERLQLAYAAKTYGELDALLVDLPGSVRPGPAAVAVAPSGDRRSPTAEWLASVWGTWAFVVAITSAVWLISSLSSPGDWHFFWPVWVAGPWGLVLLFVTVGGLSSGAPRKMAEERQRKAVAKERKRQRRALAREQAEQVERAEPAARGELPHQAGERWQMSDSKVADTPDHG